MNLKRTFLTSIHFCLHCIFFSNERERNIKTNQGTIDVQKLAVKELTVPAKLQAEVRAMTARVREDMAEKMPTTTLPYQQLLQTPERGERVRILRRIVVEEKRRLVAKKSLRSLFS